MTSTPIVLPVSPPQHTAEELRRGLALAVCAVLWDHPQIALDLSHQLNEDGFESMANSFWVMAQNALTAQPITTEENRP